MGESKPVTVDLDRIYHKYYRRRSYWEAEIRQIMWLAALEAEYRYHRLSVADSFEHYAEKVITQSVKSWISENGRFAFGMLSLNQTFHDSDTEMLPTYLIDEDESCPFELNDFLLRLGPVKYTICKWYIAYHTDAMIISKLRITQEKLDMIKLELQRDFRRGYLI